MKGNFICQQISRKAHVRSQDGWLRLVGEAFWRQVASYDSSGPFDLYSDKQDIITLQYRMCRRTNSLLQSINVFSLVLGVKKEYTENDTRPCAPTRKKKVLPSLPLNSPLDTPERTSSHALIHLICLSTKLKLVHLKRTKQCAHW